VQGPPELAEVQLGTVCVAPANLTTPPVTVATGGTVDVCQYSWLTDMVAAMLEELSNYSIPVQMEEHFSKLLQKGLTPVITHPERNPIVQRTPQRILQWVELGCVIQVTGSALTGGWGEAAWQTAQWLLKRDAVHVLATDAHDTRRRPPVLSTARKAVAETCGEEVANALVDGNPRAIVTGQPLPYFPDPVMKS